MKTIRKVALATILLGGLALAKSESVAQDNNATIKAGAFCPWGMCWVNGKCSTNCN
jgi:hypothetical protein